MGVEGAASADGRPQQAGSFPVRLTDGILQVCLIRKREKDGWGIPKGVIDPGNTPESTAMIEAYEEAGIEGRLLGRVGTYRFEKWGTRLLVVVYVLHVLEEHDDWQEARIRERQWMPFDLAASVLENHPSRPLLDTALKLAAKHIV